MKTRVVKISDIKKNPNNPRIIKDEKFNKLVKSIQEFPKMLEIRPIVVNQDMIVLGGNMRLKACKEAGLKEVPIVMADDLTEEEQKQFIIKDNVGFGEWDWEMLANEWDSDKLEDWGLDVPNFEETKELEDLSDSIVQLFKIEVECKSEEDQEKTYNKLIELGYECRLLTL
jgi:ParB-like chromosome segregation protein Spo0J